MLLIQREKNIKISVKYADFLHLRLNRDIDSLLKKESILYVLKINIDN